MTDRPAPDAAVELWIDERHEHRVTRLRERHWTVLAVSLAVIVLSCCLEVRDDQRVALTGLSRFPVPETCMSRTWFGIPCPGCGLTRSFIHLAHGRLAQSVATHHVGWILALVVVLQVPYRVLALRRSPPGGLNSPWPDRVSFALIVLLFGNWFLGLVLM